MPAAALSPNNLDEEFARLGRLSPWMASFRIAGRVYGSGLNHEQDIRPADFFRLLASCAAKARNPLPSPLRGRGAGGEGADLASVFPLTPTLSPGGERELDCRNVALAAQLATVPSPRRILELGSCQSGGSFQLAKHPGVEEVVAIEGRDYNIAKARFVQELLGDHKVRFVKGDLETFELTELGRFDAVYCVGLLYHLPNPWDLLVQLAELTGIVYINTHYCPKNQVEMSIRGYEGKKWLEFGYADPLSGLSSWSFWPTLQSLARMLLDAGFVPEFLEVNTLGVGQSPHGTTILARQSTSLGEREQTKLLEKMERVLAKLPPGAGSLQQPRKAGRFLSWLRKWA